ncbi:hypothetical protein SDC9_108910 [bioreactor metagenome]|uniref:Uncharacterized protein n=1 Tax=bioreactor metagenome TaxID=1076179 RepID=A0A645BJU8_9ZZZZ
MTALPGRGKGRAGRGLRGSSGNSAPVRLPSPLPAGNAFRSRSRPHMPTPARRWAGTPGGGSRSARKSGAARDSAPNNGNPGWRESGRDGSPAADTPCRRGGFRRSPTGCSRAGNKDRYAPPADSTAGTGRIRLRAGSGRAVKSSCRTRSSPRSG